MSISFLKFGEDSFGGSLKNKAKFHFKAEEVKSKYNDSPKGCNISGNLYEVVKIIFKNTSRKVFLGSIKNGYVVELFNADRTEAQLVKINIDNNRNVTVKAGVVDCTKNSIVIKNTYTIWEKATGTGYNGTAILLPIVYDLCFGSTKDEEAKERINDLKDYTSHADDDVFWDVANNGILENAMNFSYAIGKFTDTVYRNITDAGVNNSSVRYYMPVKNRKDSKDDKENAILSLSQGDLKVKVNEAILGNPTFFTVASTSVTKTSDFDLGSNYSDSEKLLIPSLDGLDIPEWTRSAAKYAKLSSKYPEPIRTFFFVGPAGCGKSIGSRILSGLLGLVYDIITCNPDMEIFDFIGQIYPNTGNKALDFNAVRKEMNLPSTSDIMLDPESAYIQIHRAAPKGNIDEGALIEDMISLVNEEVAKRLEGKDYIYVEGPLTKAIRYGYAVEVQEIGIVKRAGVAVGLNAILESGKNAFITLPTGETIKKHKNAVIIFTSNNGYVGTANLNQSVLSRMGDVRYFQNEKQSVMVERALKAVPDFYNKDVLTQMAGIIEQINKYCLDKGIDDGVCGQRELNNWAMEIMCDLEDAGEVEASADVIRECAQRTVINKCSQDIEAIEEVGTACIDALFGECSMYE